jgi:Tol biopolymer transport system component
MMVRAKAAIVLAVVLSGCASQTSPPALSPATTSKAVSPPVTSVVPSVVPSTPSASIPAPASSAASGAVSGATATNGKIVFSRHDQKTDDTFCFTIDPDGKNEAKGPAGSCGTLSPNGTKVLTSVFKPNGSGPLVGGRPATTNPDGSGLKVLDAYPGDKLNLDCGSWARDGRHFLCESGGDGIAADDGLYTVRSSDGGDLVRLTRAATGFEDQPSGYAPDGSRILFVSLSEKEPSSVSVINADGTGRVRLSPPDISASDFIDTAGWSPDGSQVAFSAVVPSAGYAALYVVNVDGSGLRQIVSPDIGGATAQWSPDGRWIAFTSRLHGQPQVWLIHPDGTEQVQLTDGTDGSLSLVPIWAPDGTRLLFQHSDKDTVTLFTMAPDGTGRSRVADVGSDISSYSWGVAPMHAP